MTTFKKLPISNDKKNTIATKVSGELENNSCMIVFYPSTNGALRRRLRYNVCNDVPLNNGTHLEDRQIHSNNQSANEHAEYRHNQRLEQ